MQHPDASWIVRRSIDGVECIVLGADQCSMAETIGGHRWDPGYVWPCRVGMSAGRIAAGILQTGVDFVAGWRVTVQWLRTHSDLDITIGDTVLGELIANYGWWREADIPQICPGHWNRPALVRLFDGVYLAITVTRDQAGPAADITLVLERSIAYVSAVTPIRPARGTVRPAVVGRDWVVVSYIGPPCFVSPLPLRAFIAMLIESYTIPLAYDGTQALSTDAQWNVKTIW
jgi:hypothetical protein